MLQLLDGDARAQYVASLAPVLGTGGTCYLMCVSGRRPGDAGQ